MKNNKNVKTSSFINNTMDKFVLVYGHIFRKISDFIALIIASIFFVFYQIFVQFLWLGIAIRFVEFVLSFNILKKVDKFISNKLKKTTRWESFFIFIIPLIPMEYFAIMAGIAFVAGKITLGISLYLLKFACAIPVSYIYKHTKKELLMLGSYKSFDISYTDKEFIIAHENKHTQFNMSASNIPLGWISLPKFIINISIYLIKNSRVFINISLWFKKVKIFTKQKYFILKEFIFSNIRNKPKINLNYKIKKIFNFLKNKFNNNNEQ